MKTAATEREVFFHVGLGKTASTYLQMRFFPKLRGIRYVPTARFRSYPEILRTATESRLLFSREFDRQFEDAVVAFARRCPTARPIIVLRRHDEWIASQYRRFVKNGWALTFREFFDVQADGGMWRWRDVEMWPRVRLLEELFRSRPLVLFHEELKRFPWRFLDRITEFTGSTVDRRGVSLLPFHTSYTDKQLRAMLSFGRVFNPAPPNRGRMLTWMKRRGRMLGCYALMGAGRVMPEAWIRVKTLIPPDDLAEARKLFAEDWQRCLAYAERESPNAAGAPMGAAIRAAR